MSEADAMERITGRVGEPAILEPDAVQRRGPVGVDWATIADEAELILAGAPEPDRAAAIESFARKKQISGGYLRRALAVLPVTRDPYFASVDLRAVALQGVDAIRRWSAYDKPAALAAAKVVARRRMSVMRLINDEKDARDNNKSLPTPIIGRTRDLRCAAQDWAMTRHSSTARLKASNSKLDSIFRVEEVIDGRRRSTAYLVAGPFSSHVVERNRMKRIVLQALGLMVLDGKVVLICASPEGKSFADAYLKGHNVDISDMTVVSSKDTFLGEPGPSDVQMAS